MLLVEDDPIQLRTREAILRGAGLEVCIATSARSALALVRAEAHDFGAIITDHLMPDLSGAEFVRQLRAMNHGIPVIVLSGLPDAQQEYEGLDATFRQKPCPPAELIRLVRRFVDKAA